MTVQEYLAAHPELTAPLLSMRAEVPLSTLYAHIAGRPAHVETAKRLEAWSRSAEAPGAPFMTATAILGIAPPERVARRGRAGRRARA